MQTAHGYRNIYTHTECVTIWTNIEHDLVCLLRLINFETILWQLRGTTLSASFFVWRHSLCNVIIQAYILYSMWWQHMYSRTSFGCVLHLLKQARIERIKHLLHTDIYNLIKLPKIMDPTYIHFQACRLSNLGANFTMLRRLSRV